jgi:hypothetical protein
VYHGAERPQLIARLLPQLSGGRLLEGLSAIETAAGRKPEAHARRRRVDPLEQQQQAVAVPHDHTGALAGPNGHH